MGGSLGRRALAEFIGTALLVTAVIGSGIAASRLSPHDIGLELFENAAATSAARWRSSLRWDRYRARTSTRSSPSSTARSAASRASPPPAISPPRLSAPLRAQ